MKHFRLLACLAIIATFTSVFAAWELENYAESYKDEAGLDVTLVTNIEDKEALIVEITNTEMPTVVFDAGEADVSGDVNVKVTTNIADEDLSKYNYYYVVFSDAQLVSKVPGLTEYVPNTDGVEFPATSAMTVLEVGEDGVHVWGTQQMGGEDAGFYYQVVPGCFFNLCCQTAHSDGKIYPGHNSKFMIDDSLLYRGTAVFVQGAIDYLNK